MKRRPYLQFSLQIKTRLTYQGGTNGEEIDQKRQVILCLVALGCFALKTDKLSVTPCFQRHNTKMLYNSVSLCSLF